MRGLLAVSVVLGTLLIDQISKIWVKTNMYLGQEIPVLGDFFKIHFIENPGMAFGIEFGGAYGKLFLTVFRIIAVVVITFILRQLIGKKASFKLIFGISLILAGAMGNIIDSVFYGVLFSKSTFSSTYGIAEMFPADGGYSELMHGYVVDMLHFTILKGRWPEWMPFIGGDYFEFFRPIFNIADSAITLGILYLIIFQRSIFMSEEEELLGSKEKTVKA